MKNILVVSVNWMGDVIFSTPVFKALREQYPDARLCCMAAPRVEAVLKCCPYIDDVIIYDENGAHKWLWGKLLLIFQMRAFHFDIAFLLHRSWTRAFMVYLAGARERVGYDLKDLGRLLTHKVELPDGDVHRADYYLRVIESWGIPVRDRMSRLVVPEHERERIRIFLALKGIRDSDFLILVHAGGNWDLKRWPMELFAAFIERVSREMKAKVILTGGKEDVVLSQEIRERSHVDPVVLTGKTHLENLFALMERADVVVSSDSGPLHAASSVGTATVAIFGPTSPAITGPRGTGPSIVLQKEVGCNASACYNLECRDNKCMKAVTVDEVVATVGTFYERWQGFGRSGDVSEQRGDA